MRVLFLNNEFPPLGGGTGTVNFKLFKALSGHSDFNIDLITARRNGTEEPLVHFSERISLIRVNVHNRNIHHASAIELLTYTIKAMWVSWRLSKTKKYDLIFAFSTVPAGAVGYVIAKLRSVPLIISLQGPDIPGFEPRYRSLYPFLKPLLKFLWRKADQVMVLSKGHQELAERTMRRNFVLIPNGADVAQFKQAERVATAGIRFLCVARLIERKGIDFLLRAVAELATRRMSRPFSLTIVGTGDEEDHLKAYARKLSVDHCVTFTGFVAPENMSEIYARSDVFILTSRHEGMSMALLEALASGLPCVVTRVGGSAELVETPGTGFVVEVDDLANTVDSMQKLVENTDLRERMGQAAVEVAKRYSWSAITDEYRKLFSEVIERRSESQHIFG